MGRQFKQPGGAAFKLWVSYKDGGRASLHSRDWNGSKYLPRDGLLQLERYVASKSHLIRTALIYDKRGGGDRLVRKYTRGSWTVRETIGF